MKLLYLKASSPFKGLLRLDASPPYKVSSGLDEFKTIYGEPLRKLRRQRMAAPVGRILKGSDSDEKSTILLADILRCLREKLAG